MGKHLLDMQQRKQLALDMAKHLHKVCAEHGLRYFMDYGTLLGAVRHNGFIPWDDDLDVAMPREDFFKLQDLINKDNTPYQVEFYNNKAQYGYATPKMVDTRTTLIDEKMGYGREVTGVFLDIFIYDGVGNQMRPALAYCACLKILKRMVFLSRRNFVMESIPKTVLFAIPWVICRLIGVDAINRLLNRLCAKRSFDEDALVACVAGDHLRRNIFPRQMIEGQVLLPFEDTQLCAPEAYDQYLTQLYGDYMTLPPEDQRIPPHLGQAFWNGEEEL